MKINKKMERTFKNGDTVRLKSGSPLMTVNKNINVYHLDGSVEFKGEVECKWFDDKNVICTGKFKQDALELNN